MSRSKSKAELDEDYYISSEIDKITRKGSYNLSKVMEKNFQTNHNDSDENIAKVMKAEQEKVNAELKNLFEKLKKKYPHKHFKFII